MAIGVIWGSGMNVSTINSEQTLKFHIDKVKQVWAEKKWLQLTWNFDKGRTSKQNSALHVYCKLLADALNESGQYMQIIMIDDVVEIEWTDKTVKDIIWREIQKAYCKKHSTTKLTTKETMEIYDIVNRFTAQSKGVSVAWPVRGEG